MDTYQNVLFQKSNRYSLQNGIDKYATEVREVPSKASVLFLQSGSNIHSLTAVTPCALLDVLAPPYAEDLGRPSTYFDIPIPSLPVCMSVG